MTTSTERLNELFRTGQIELRRGTLFNVMPPPLPADGLDKVEGMLLGLAVGDALGNTSEGLLPYERRARHGEVRDYLPNPHAASRRVGLPSDDTQLAFWTLEQLLEEGALLPEQLARRFAAGRIFGIGATVKEFLHKYKAGTPWHACGPHSAGNGALMRIAPILLPHLRNPSAELWADTALCAMLTHNDSASTAACLAFVSMLWGLIAMRCPPAPDWWLERYVETARELELDRDYAPRGERYLNYRGPLWRYAEQIISQAWARSLGVAEACASWYSGAYLGHICLRPCRACSTSSCAMAMRQKRPSYAP